MDLFPKLSINYITVYCIVQQKIQFISIYSVIRKNRRDVRGGPYHIVFHLFTWMGLVFPMAVKMALSEMSAGPPIVMLLAAPALPL